MSERYDAIVVGADLVGSFAAAHAAAAGARVLLVERGPTAGASGLSGGALRPDGSSAGPTRGAEGDSGARRLIEHRMLVLEDGASVSFDVRDVSMARAPVPATAIRSVEAAARWADAAAAKGGRLLTEARGVRLRSPSAGSPAGVEVSGKSFEAPRVIVTDPIAAATDSAPVLGMRMEETYALAPGAIESRFQLRPGEGTSLECLIGFLPTAWTGWGWVLTHRAHVTVGVTLFRPASAGSEMGLEAAFDRFVHHPAIVGFIAGGERVDRRSHPVPAVPARRRLSQGGVLLAGAAAGLGDPIGVLAPGLRAALESGRAAADSVPVPSGGSRTGTASPASYLARLRSSGVLAQIDRARAHPVPLGWDGFRHQRYARILGRTFHELLTETGAPKEPITRTLRRVRRESRVAYGTLALDAADLTREL